MEGFVGKHCVGILRDTGCSGVIVRRSLVEPSEFTGKKRTLMMVDKSLIQVPTAICIVNCPVFSGRVEALYLEDPVCDVIIGNVPGALLVGESQVAKCILVKETRCSHNALLYSHADTRIGEKPFKCNICRKHFSRRSYLQRHKHTHTGENHLSVTSVKTGLHDSVICRDISILTQVKNWSRVLHVVQRTHVVLVYRVMCVLKEVRKN